jgi:hypothetical protein
MSKYKYEISHELESIIMERFLEITDVTKLIPEVDVTKTGKFVNVTLDSDFLDGPTFVGQRSRGCIRKSTITLDFLNEIYDNFDFIKNYFGFKRCLIIVERHQLIPPNQIETVGIIYRAYSISNFRIVARFTNGSN